MRLALLALLTVTACEIRDDVIEVERGRCVEPLPGAVECASPVPSVECCELDTGDTYCREEADPCRWWRVYWHAPGAEPVVEAR